MKAVANGPARDDIARVAFAIWEAEGRPEGRDHEHWMRAKELLRQGRAEIEYPESALADPDPALPAPANGRSG